MLSTSSALRLPFAIDVALCVRERGGVRNGSSASPAPYCAASPGISVELLNATEGKSAEDRDPAASCCSGSFDEDANEADARALRCADRVEPLPFIELRNTLVPAAPAPAPRTLPAREAIPPFSRPWLWLWLGILFS